MEENITYNNDTNYIGYNIVEEKMTQAKQVLKNLKEIKKECVSGLELVIREMCDKHQISFSKHFEMYGWSFEFEMYETQVRVDHLYLTKLKFGKVISQFYIHTNEDLESRFEFNHSLRERFEGSNEIEKIIFCEEELIILEKVKSFYADLKILLNKVNEINNIFDETQQSIINLAKGYNYENKQTLTIK